LGARSSSGRAILGPPRPSSAAATVSGLSASMSAAELRRRAVAPPAPAAEAPASAAEQEDGPPRKWHEFLSVRVILVLLALFFTLHLFLWKVVYQFWMAQDLVKLRNTVNAAKESLNRVVEHL
jgi:hypothetical protein